MYIPLLDQSTYRSMYIFWEMNAAAWWMFFCESKIINNLVYRRNEVTFFVNIKIHFLYLVFGSYIRYILKINKWPTIHQCGITRPSVSCFLLCSSCQSVLLSQETGKDELVKYIFRANDNFMDIYDKLVEFSFDLYFTVFN